MDQSPSFQQVLDTQSNAILLQVQHWIKYEVFSFQFWLLIAILILPWIIWAKLLDKKRILEIFLYGLLVITVVTFLDEVGCQMNLWEYAIDIEPYFPRLIPVNFSLLPVGYMLLYQYFPKWRSFVLANIVAATFYTFVGEPLLVLIKVYILIQWKHIYSFPFYILIAISLKALTCLIMKKYKYANLQ